jgi:hypothetical protein
MGVMENSDLLRELRIDRRETEPASRRPLWIALGAVALVIAGGIAWFALSAVRRQPCIRPSPNR